MSADCETWPQRAVTHKACDCIRWLALLVIVALIACSPKPQATVADADTPGRVAATRAPPTVTVPAPTPAACALTPVIAPTRPAETPGYVQLDPNTGLHMTGDPVEIDLADYRLEVTGNVDRPLSLTYNDLRCMSRIEGSPVLICPGFFEDTATWAGVPLADVLELAGLQTDAGGLRLIGADGYSALVTIEMATSGKSYLAYEWEGEPLPILHGFPVRAVFPDHGGSVWVKWLVRIDVIG